MTAQDQPQAGQSEQQEPSGVRMAYEPATVEQCQEDYRRHQALDPKPPLPRGAEEDES